MFLIMMRIGIVMNIQICFTTAYLTFPTRLLDFDFSYTFPIITSQKYLIVFFGRFCRISLWRVWNKYNSIFLFFFFSSSVFNC